MTLRDARSAANLTRKRTKASVFVRYRVLFCIATTLIFGAEILTIIMRFMEVLEIAGVRVNNIVGGLAALFQLYFGVTFVVEGILVAKTLKKSLGITSGTQSCTEDAC